MTGRDVIVCEWFALCDRPAAGIVHHPALGQVPTCKRCRTKLDLELWPWACWCDAPAEILDSGRVACTACQTDLTVDP